MDSGTLERNYRLAFEALPGYHLLLYADVPVYTIGAISDELVNVTSLTKKTIVGKSVFSATDFFGTLPAESVVYILKNVLETRSEYTHQSKPGLDGMPHFPRPLTVSFKPILDEDESVVFVLITLSTKSVDGSSTTSMPMGQPPIRNFSDILSQAPVGMAIVKGEDFVLEVANPQILKLWGKSTDVIGLPIVEALPEIASQPFPVWLRNVYESGIEYHGVETPAYVRHGSYLLLSYFNFVYSPLKNEAGEVIGIMIIASDVTSLVKARKELEESEKRYRDLIAKATVATAIYVGENMIIRLANEAMLKLWGKTNKIIGRTLRESIPELEGQPFFDLLQRVYRTGVTYHSTEDKAELVVEGKRQVFYFNFTYKALRDSDGKIYGILNMAVDVSDTVRARLTLKEAEERWRIALQSAALGTWDFYPGTGKFCCSARTKALYGFSQDEVVTLDRLFAAMQPRDRRRLQSAMERALRGEGPSHYRVDYAITRSADQKQGWLRATGQVFYDEHGAPLRVTGTVLDISERKQIEEALEERVMQRTKELMQMNKALERSNHELEQYAYVASHDLQEPLRKILVYSDMLRNEVQSSQVAVLRLEKIMSSANRMSSLIRDLLNFSKLVNADRIFTEVDLNRSVHTVMEDFELRIRETNARVEVSMLPTIEASPEQVNQLFHNLLSNALKFRRDDEAPHVRISAAILSDEEKHACSDLNQVLHYCRITIEDNGIGFSTRYLTQIFEIFKRLHNRSKFEGTGIGLALCRRIARNHQGDIIAESKEGSGSRFHVFLPVKQQPV